jgi:DNA-binding LacI/PurR family transcriptional regulator
MRIMPTIKDVAREAGVSIATVSYVLNNKLGSVSQETRQNVLQAIARVGYTPNITARNLKNNQTRLIGYAWHEVPSDQVNPVLDRFTYHLARAAEAVGYHLLTFTHKLTDPIPAYNDLIRTQRVDAFVLAGTQFDDPRIQFLSEVKFPFVCFGRSNLEWSFPYVDTDGEAGTRAAIEYLVSLGHRRIGMAAWGEDSISGSFRLAGYQAGMAAAGLTVRPGDIIRGEHSEWAGRSALREWLKMPAPERPTAVIAITDLVAIGIMNEAEQHGLVIGRDLSVMGFDDAPMVQYLRPALTTMQQAIVEMTEMLVEMVEQVLKSSDFMSRKLIPPRMIVRASCGRPNQT